MVMQKGKNQSTRRSSRPTVKEEDSKDARKRREWFSQSTCAVTEDWSESGHHPFLRCKKEKAGRKKANTLLQRQELKMVLLMIGLQGHQEVR